MSRFVRKVRHLLCLRMTKFKCTFWLVITILIVGGWYLPTLLDLEDDLPLEGDFSLKKNYFRLSNVTYFQDGFLVDNDKCRIPNVNVWNAEVRSHLKGPKLVSCQNKHRDGTINGLTFVNKQTIVINRKLLMKNLGLTLDDIDCCYRTIARVQLSLSNYHEGADRDLVLSSECYKMTSEVTTPTSGFIKVICNKRFLRYWYTPLHTDLHLLATFQNPSSLLAKKINYWNNSAKSHRRPPNVLLLGVDSTSRLHFRRGMPTTRNVLEELLGAMEMGGYTKVGENTFPNIVPLLSSFSAEELASVCMRTWVTAQDRCPYLWKSFSSAHYLTAHVEDAPVIAIFHYGKTGFVFPPTDIYPRPWMQAVYKDDSNRCVDSLRPDEIVLRYLVDLIELAETHGLPFFITTWISALTHDRMNSHLNVDISVREALLQLKERGYLRNTVLLVMGDHGYRFSSIRKSVTGWFEDKLPALWISLPETVKQLKPEWMESLAHNSKQLTTPFNVHETLKDILTINGNKSLETRKTLRGGSLFEKLSPRTCQEAGVPVIFCACGSLSEFTDSNSNILRMAADAVISKINGNLPSTFCTRLRVDRVIGAGISESGNSSKLVLGILAAPEKIEMEALVSFNATGGKWDVLGLLRTNSFYACDLVSYEESEWITFFCQCSGLAKPKDSSVGWDGWISAIFMIALMIIVLLGTRKLTLTCVKIFRSRYTF